MRRLRRFIGLTAAERRLLLWTLVLLASIRLGLRVLPVRPLRHLLHRGPWGPQGGKAQRLSAERIVGVVTMASQVVPGCRTCLIQAFAAQVLLRRAGYAARCHIGVAKGQDGQFAAHAWVESQGRIVIGGSSVARYTPLVVFEGARS